MFVECFSGYFYRSLPAWAGGFPNFALLSWARFLSFSFQGDRKGREPKSLTPVHASATKVRMIAVWRLTFRCCWRVCTVEFCELVSVLCFVYVFLLCNAFTMYLFYFEIEEKEREDGGWKMEEAVGSRGKERGKKKEGKKRNEAR